MSQNVQPPSFPLDHYPLEGIVDSKGRQLGARVSAYTNDHPEWSGYYVKVQPTRAGKDFGASLDSKKVAELDDEDALDKVDREVGRRLKNMDRSYRKKLEAGKL